MDFRWKITGEKRAGEAGKGICCLWIRKAIRRLSALGFWLNHTQHHGFRSIPAKLFQFFCFLPQPARKLSKQALKTCLVYILMDEEIFQYLSFFSAPLGPEFGSIIMWGKGIVVSVLHQVSAVLLPVNNGDIRHAHHWHKVLLRKQCERPKLNLHLATFSIHCFK